MRRPFVVTAAAGAGVALVVVAHSVTQSTPVISAGALHPATTEKTRHDSADPPTTSPSSTTAPSGTTTTSHSATGALEQYGYGEISVTISVENGRIVNAKVASLQTNDSFSQSVAEEAIPVLKNEVLDAQGAKISAVSGATYTSEGYAASVQSALDKLHLQ